MRRKQNSEVSSLLRPGVEQGFFRKVPVHIPALFEQVIKDYKILHVKKEVY